MQELETSTTGMTDDSDFSLAATVLMQDAPPKPGFVINPLTRPSANADSGKPPEAPAAGDDVDAFASSLFGDNAVSKLEISLLRGRNAFRFPQEFYDYLPKLEELPWPPKNKGENKDKGENYAPFIRYSDHPFVVVFRFFYTSHHIVDDPAFRDDVQAFVVDYLKDPLATPMRAVPACPISSLCS